MEKFAGAILITKEGKILLQQRDNIEGVENPGKIALFGGSINEDEEPMNAVIRELKEELCLSLSTELLEFFQEYHKTKEVHGKDVVSYIYISKNIDDKKLKLMEGEEIIYLSPKDDLNKYNLTIMAKDVLNDFLKI